MLWQLIEEENKKKIERGPPRDEDDTRHLLLTFSVISYRRLLSLQPDLQFYLRYYVDVSLNSAWPLAILISRLMEKGRVTYTTISSSSLHCCHVTCSGGLQRRSLVMFYLLRARRREQNVVKRTSTALFICVLYTCNVFLSPFFLSAAFIAALYIDKDLEYVHTFMNVCFFPRLKVSAYS